LVDATPDESQSAPPKEQHTEDISGDITEVWSPIRSWVSRVPGRAVLVAAIGLLCLQAATRAYAFTSGWFLFDDLTFIMRSATMDTWSADYLFTGYNGHFMPGSFLWVSLTNALWPTSYLSVVISTLVMQALLGALVYKILVALFGRRPAILIPLTIFLFSTMTLSAFSWWAAALNQIPGMVAAALALWFQIRMHRTGRTRWGYLALGALIVGLAFHEKVLLIIPGVLALTFFWFTPGAPIRRLRLFFRENRTLLACYVVVLVSYLTFYVMHIPSPVNGRPTALVGLQTVATNLTGAVIPSLFGGPFTWGQLGLGAVAFPISAVVIVTLSATVMLIATSIFRRYRAVFGWAVLIGYWLANAVILGVTRAAWVGDIIGREYRYVADVTLPIVVFGSLAFLPLAGTWRRGKPQLLLPRRAWGAAASQRAMPWPKIPEAWWVTPVCVGLIVMSLVSTMSWVPLWRNDVTPKYLDVVRADLDKADLDKADHPLVMANVPLPNPSYPIPPTGVDTKMFVSGLGYNLKVLERGESTDALYQLDDQGHVRETKVDGFPNESGPEPGCGWRVDREPQTIPLQAKTMGWDWWAQVTYIATNEAETTITVGTVTSKVHILPGTHSLFVVGSGEVSDVTFTPLTYGGLCTDYVRVGFAQPVPDSRPWK